MQNKIHKNLLIVNNYMDVSHPALAHQSEIALALASNFNNVYILTGKNNNIILPSNSRIFTYKSKLGFLPVTIFKFIVLFLYLISSKRINVVFSHMSSRHSAVMAPLLKLFRIKHVLWYAHKSRPFTLSLSYLFLDKLVTSTKGSCPIQGSKVLYIGQSIEETNFRMKVTSSSDIYNFVHIGRFDPSKNIDLILSSFIKLRTIHSKTRLTIIGNPSGNNSCKYKKMLEEKYLYYLNRGIITFLQSVPRVNMGQVLSNYDAFVHAFRGSLDKTLLEATLSGLPVVTLNSEYINEFGNWCLEYETEIELEKELLCLMNLPLANRNGEILRRRNLVLENHSLVKWIEKLTNILIQD